MSDLNSLHERIFETLHSESKTSPRILSNPNYDILFNNKTINTHRDFLKVSDGEEVLLDFCGKFESFGKEAIPQTLELVGIYKEAVLNLKDL